MKEIKFAFEDLKVYQKALDFVDIAYEPSSRFPPQENYALASQLNRAAVSIALNISEGSGDTNAQFNRFLQIAMNSVKECLACETIAKGDNILPLKKIIWSDQNLRNCQK